MTTAPVSPWTLRFRAPASLLSSTVIEYSHSFNLLHHSHTKPPQSPSTVLWLQQHTTAAKTGTLDVTGIDPGLFWQQPATPLLFIFQHKSQLCACKHVCCDPYSCMHTCRAS